MQTDRDLRPESADKGTALQSTFIKVQAEDRIHSHRQKMQGLP